MRAVKVSEVGAIEWFNRANGWGKKRNVLGMVFEGGGFGGAKFVKAVGTMTKKFHNMVGMGFREYTRPWVMYPWQGRVDQGGGEVLRSTINLAKAIVVWKGRLNERVEAAG